MAEKEVVYAAVAEYQSYFESDPFPEVDQKNKPNQNASLFASMSPQELLASTTFNNIIPEIHELDGDYHGSQGSPVFSGTAELAAFAELPSAYGAFHSEPSSPLHALNWPLPDDHGSINSRSFGLADSNDTVQPNSGESEGADERKFLPTSRFMSASNVSSVRQNAKDLIPLYRHSTRKRLDSLQELLQSNEKVRRVAVLKPRAGPFEGKTTAFLTLAAGPSEELESAEVKLLYANQPGHLQFIRRSLEGTVVPEDLPEVCVFLERIPLDEAGNVNQRILQTWIQNANEESRDHINLINSPESGNSSQTNIDTERRIRKVIGLVLGIEADAVDMSCSFARLGGDPINAMQVVTMCEPLGFSLQYQDVLQARSLSQLSSAAVHTQTEDSSIDISEDVAEETCLSPMQRLYFHTGLSGRLCQGVENDVSRRFHQSVLFRIRKTVSIEDVCTAIETLVEHHSMLRARFRRRAGSWVQYVLLRAKNGYHFGHHVTASNEELESVVRQAQLNIDIKKGPVFAAHHIQTESGGQLLFLIAHHLVADLRSWEVIAADVEELLTSRRLMSSKTPTFQEWIMSQKQRASHRENPEFLPFQPDPSTCQYWGLDVTDNTYARALSAGFTLGSETTALLAEGIETSRIHPTEVFLSALVQSFGQTFEDRPVPTVWIQERERTLLGAEPDMVGWFASPCPLTLSVPPGEEILKTIRRVKDSRQAIPDHGVPFFISKMADPVAAERFSSLYSPFELLFSYTDSKQSIKRRNEVLENIPAPDTSFTSLTSNIGPKVGRIALFEVAVVSDQNETTFRFIFSRDAQRSDCIRAWIQSYEKSLRKAIELIRFEKPRLSSSDCSMLNITDEGLARLNEEVIPGMNIDMRNIDTIYPTTAKQRNILINEQLMPGSSIAFITCELDNLGQKVDTGVLCNTWGQVTERYESLRTVFIESVTVPGSFDQVVLRHYSPNMLFIESEDGETAFTTLENLPPLSLVKGVPWIRMVVCRAPGKALFKLEVSQALCDIMSLSILFREFHQVYMNLPTPYECPISHSSLLKSLESTPEDIVFWRDRLKNPEPCHFPTGPSTSDATGNLEFDFVNLGIPREILYEFSDRQNISLSAIFRVAWSLVLRAYVGLDRTYFGYRISGRDISLPTSPFSVGCFSTVLTSCLAINSMKLLSDMLLDAEEQHASALLHQQVPVEDIENALNIRGGHLFNTCLTLGYESSLENLPGSSDFRCLKTGHTSWYDVEFSVDFRNGGVAIDVGHRMLTPNQVKNVAHAFGRAILTVVKTPSLSCKDVDLFSEHHSQQILAWNSQTPKGLSTQHVHRLIASNAVENPELQAVCAWDGEFSYGELDQMAVTLASHLLDTGLEPGEPVPVIVDKSRWAVVGMLSVLNAGAVLVPLDAELTTYFQEVVGSVGARFVIASDHVRQHLKDMKIDVVYLNDKTMKYMASRSVEVTPPQTRDQDMASILFNFGTTTRNKGITYSHAALATACSEQGSTLWINSSSRVMQMSSFSVDIALSEVFTTLIHGGCVCVPSAAERISGFAQAARRMNVNWAYLTPWLSRRLEPESLPNLAVVCFRTRHLDHDTWKPWSGKANVLLTYGSAMTCPFALSASLITNSNEIGCIGRPFCGNYWIVDRDNPNRLMPVGAIGELVIGSPTLANNLGDREVKDWSHGSSPRSLDEDTRSSRLFKTGHFVRYRDDGQVELVSAQKAQINGISYRPAEVESRLRRCLGRGNVVIESMTFMLGSGQSRPVLIAFLEIGKGYMLGSMEHVCLNVSLKQQLRLLRSTAEPSLREAFSGHMVPSIFVPVQQFPLTPSLKINRHALQKIVVGIPEPQLLELAELSNHVKIQNSKSPRDSHGTPVPTEQIVRAVWSDTLQIDGSLLAAHDRFLDSGGNTNLAYEFVNSCRRQNVKASVVDLLRNVTLGELCQVVTYDTTLLDVHRSSLPGRDSNASQASIYSVLPHLGYNEDSIADVAPASALQLISLEAHAQQENMNYFIIEIAGRVDSGKLEDACALLTEYHPILRTAFIPHNRQVLQVVLRSWLPDFQRRQSPRKLLTGQVKKLIERDQAAPIDYRRPLTKFWHVEDTAKACSALILRLSRAQIHDRSIITLVRHLGNLYANGELEARPGSFCDAVRAAQQACSSGATEYWKSYLAGSEMTLVCSAKPDGSSLNSKTLIKQIPATSLRHVSIPFHVLLKGAWAIVLSNLSRKSDVVFGELVTGSRLDLSQSIVGPMGNIAPVRVVLSDAPTTPYDYLQAIQKQWNERIPHENMQFSDTIKTCTEWPAWTRFSTMVHHQPRGERDEAADFDIGGVECTVDCVESNRQNSDIFVRSSDETYFFDISLTYCESKVPKSFATGVLDMLCSTILKLMSTRMTDPVVLRGMSNVPSLAKLPLTINKKPSRPTLRSLPLPIVPVQPSHADAINSIISSAWTEVLGPNISRTLFFYDIWGSLVPAAELARHYNQAVPQLNIFHAVHATFTATDIVNNPTMAAQFDMIVAKCQAPSGRQGSLANIHSSAMTEASLNSFAHTTSPLQHIANLKMPNMPASDLSSLVSDISHSEDDDDEAKNRRPHIATLPRRKSMMGHVKGTLRRKGTHFLGKFKLGNVRVGGQLGGQKIGEADSR